MFFTDVKRGICRINFYFMQFKIYVLYPLTHFILLVSFRSSPPEVILVKGVLKICSKLTGEHPYRSAISIKLQSNFIETSLRHGCSPVNLLHLFRIIFPKNTSEGLLLFFLCPLKTS